MGSGTQRFRLAIGGWRLAESQLAATRSIGADHAQTCDGLMSGKNETPRTTSNKQPATAPLAKTRAASAGFSVAELITVVAIIAILAAVALPVARFGIRRQKEVELHGRLRKITDAIDRYQELMTLGQMPQQQQQGGMPGQAPPPRPAQMQALGSDGYPKTLDELLKGVKMSDGKTIRLLRERDLIDPMTGRNEWIVLSTTDDPDTSMTNGDNVFEVHSTSTSLALDGKTHYNEW